jgi:hypothetical protein
MSSTVSCVTLNEDNTWRTNTFLFNRVCVYFDNHCGETVREAITTMCHQKGYPLDLIVQNVTEAGAARTIFNSNFGKGKPWPFAVDSDYECYLGRQVEIEATRKFEGAKDCMTNEDEVISLCNNVVTTTMKEVKEVSLHLPYRRFRKASLLLASGKFLAEAQMHPSTPMGKIYGKWRQGHEALRTNRFIARMGVRIMATPDRSSNPGPATPPPVEAPQSIPETPESSRAVLSVLTPATPIGGALEGSASGHAAAPDLSPAAAGSGGLQHKDTPRPEKVLKRKRGSRK